MKLIISSLFLWVHFFAVCQNWQQGSSIPSIGRDDGVSFSINGYGYVVTGNQNGFSESNKMFRYSPSLDSWEEVTPFPGEKRQYAGAFVINNLAYLIGGYSSANQALKDVWQFNPQTESWIQLNDFPGDARWSFFTFSTSENGYLGTGATMAAPTVSDCWKYDPKIDKWNLIQVYPEGAIREVAGFCIGEDCFAGTGLTTNPLLFSKKFYKYNPRKDQWTEITDFPGEPRGYAGATQFGLNAVVGGGWGDQNQFFKDVYQLSLNGEWSKLPDFPFQGWRGMTCFTINNTAYFSTGLYEDLSRTSDLYALSNSNTPKSIVYPNPTDDFSVLFTSNSGKIQIFDLSAKKVAEFSSNAGVFLLLPTLSPGTYLIQIIADNNTEILRWIVK